VWMLCDGIMEHKGRMSANKKASILKFKIGDEIRLDAGDFARLSAAFFDEIEKTYP
jgi:hypothetical protein